MIITERFLKYVSFCTTSDEQTNMTPSTPGQMEFAKYLADELRAIGMQEVTLDDNGYVMATLPANVEGKPTIGFIAHMDTVSEFTEGEIRPILTPDYNGEDLPLGDSGRVLTVKNFPHLPSLKGRTLITSDGTTILGVDNKAGIAEIMTMVERLRDENIPHGQSSCVNTHCTTPRPI